MSARSRSAWLATLAALALVALAPRLAPLRGLRLGRAPEPRALALEHPGTLVALRRTALALAARRVPASDRWLAWPEEVELPSAPLLPALLAVALELWPAPADGEPALGGRAERELEALALGVGPLLALLALAGVALAAGGLARRGSRARAALAAALGLALAPDLVRASAAARLDERALVVLLGAFALAGLARAFSGRDPIARAGGALLAGVAAGLALALSPLGLALLAAALGAALQALLGRDEVAAEAARREALLLAIAAAGAASLPGLEGPWELVPGGRLALAARRGAELALASAGLVVLAALVPRRGARLARAAGVVALALLAGAALWHARDGLGAALELAREQRLLALEPLERGARAGLAGALVDALAGLGPLFALAPLAALRLLATRGEAGRPRPPRAALAVLALVAWLACALERSLAPAAALPAALCVALAWAELERPRRRALLGALALVAALAAVLPASLPLDEAARTARAGRVAALRALRRESESPGPWNAPRARADWGVLAAPALGPAVAWHARRPALLSGPYPADARRERALAALAALEEPGSPEARERAAELGAAWVLLGGRGGRDPRLIGPLPARTGD